MGRINRNNAVSDNLIISTEEQRNFVRKGRDRFLEEARNIAQFGSEPGIVNVKGFFEANETAYIIMEYLEGRTMAEHIKECGPMDVEKIRELMLPLVEALSKIHKLGVIHWDISPDNIMYLNQGTCKLMDFGSARYFMQQNQELTSTVKRGYTPEEQYTSTGKQGPWTDVYGLCATMYKCITGVTPPDAVDRMAYDSLKRPSELGAKISREFENTLMYGLALHAKDRCQNMDELLHLMKNGSQGQQGNAAEDDPDATMFADQTYYSKNQTNTQTSYTNTMQTSDSEQRYSRGGKKKSLIPAILGCIVVIVAAVLVIWNVAGKDDKEVKTIGDYYVTGCKDVLKVRKTENADSKVLAKLDNGEKVSLVERTNNNCWKVYVESEEVTGYLDYHYLINERDAAMEPAEKYVNVSGDEELTILNAPEKSGTSVGILERGDEITVLAMPGETYAYIHAPDANAFGYVRRDKLSDEKPEQEKTENSQNSQTNNNGIKQETQKNDNNMSAIQQNVYEPSLDTAGDYEVLIKNVSSGLNVRSEPTHNSSLLCTINDQTQLLYYGEWEYGIGSDDQMHRWCKVYNISTPGWVRSDCVMKCGIYYQKNVESSLNLRSEPEHNSSLVFSVNDDRPLFFYGEVQQGYGSDGEIHDWYKVYIGDGITGWARSDYLNEGDQYG